jgi:hypothetical protein
MAWSGGLLITLIIVHNALSRSDYIIIILKLLSPISNRVAVFW